MNITLSLVQFLSIAAANFVLSWLYYSPAVPWFRRWQIEVGLDPDRREMTAAEKQAMPRLMGGAVAASLLFSAALQMVVRGTGADSFADGALVGLILWLGFVVTHSLNTQFEGRSPMLIAINNVHYAVTYLLFGGILAVWL